jgi:DNA-binding NtrC family response regulator
MIPEKELIINALEQSGGKKAAAARLLGISRQALWKKMNKVGIQRHFVCD